MAIGEALPNLRQKALQMARSGRFCGWRLIDIDLRFVQGLKAADPLFQDLALRDEVDLLCRAAQRHRRPHPAVPVTLLPVPQYRFRGGDLPRPQVIRFLDENAASTTTDFGPDEQAPRRAGAGAP
ncbi:hypothetical protein [Xanthobacter agilis]|uniref:hypothetical protein n=1 Tax=Xanthobacter agilis TaxID=47492 RepID=UPI00372737A7